MKNRRNGMMLVLAGATMLATAAMAAEPAAPKAAAAKAPAADAHAGAAAAPAAAEKPAAKIEWDKMNFAARKKYMKATVLPEMKKVFAAFDPKAYANVTCATCHGKDSAEKKFKMPNADLPKLPGPTDRAAFMALAEKKPEVVKFMGTQVKPKMASLLGVAEWTPASPTGFACYNCHTHEEGAPGAAAPKATAPAAAGKPEPKGW
jgi:hypothetical protein